MTNIECVVIVFFSCIAVNLMKPDKHRNHSDFPEGSIGQDSITPEQQMLKIIAKLKILILKKIDLGKVKISSRHVYNKQFFLG
jgi:hypothetical protein